MTENDILSGPTSADMLGAEIHVHNGSSGNVVHRHPITNWTGGEIRTVGAVLLTENVPVAQITGLAAAAVAAADAVAPGAIKSVQVVCQGYARPEYEGREWNWVMDLRVTGSVTNPETGITSRQSPQAFVPCPCLGNQIAASLIIEWKTAPTATLRIGLRKKVKDLDPRIVDVFIDPNPLVLPGDETIAYTGQLESRYRSEAIAVEQE